MTKETIEMGGGDVSEQPQGRKPNAERRENLPAEAPPRLRTTLRRGSPFTGFMWSAFVVSIVGMSHQLWTEGGSPEVLFLALGCVCFGTTAWTRTF